MQARLAQVVYTLTQFPTVKGVLFSLDGVQICVLDCVRQADTRRDYADVLPAILVTSPALNQAVGSPVVIRGSANVFEANVGIQILEENGEVIAETFTTATCGTGCRGTFRARVPYQVDREQEGTIVVHDDDAAGNGHLPARGPNPGPTPAVTPGRPTRGAPSDVEASLPAFALPRTCPGQ